MSHHDSEPNESRLVRLREEQRQFLIAQDEKTRRIHNLETALSYEVRAHAATKRELTKALERIAHICSRTQRIATDGVMVCDVRGIELWCHYEAHEDGLTITDVYVEPDQSIYDLMSARDSDCLAGQIADVLEEESRNG